MKYILQVKTKTQIHYFLNKIWKHQVKRFGKIYTKIVAEILSSYYSCSIKYMNLIKNVANIKKS